MVTSIVGHAKQQAQYFSRKHKIRYTESNNIIPGQFARLKFPTYGNQFLDCRSIYACFYLQGLPDDDEDAMLDGIAQIVFDHIRVISGTSVLCDITQAGLLFQSLYDLNNSKDTSAANRYEVGDSTDEDKKAWFALASPGRQYIVKLCPRGSLLNMEALLPLANCSELSVEITFASAALSCVSTSVNTSWNISKFELHCDYIESPVIAQYFANTPLQISTTNYDYRFNSIVSTTQAQFRFSSALSSLDKLFAIFRNGTTSQAITTAEKARTSISGQYLLKYNLLVNSTRFYEDDIDSLVECYEEVRDGFPAIATAEFYGSNFWTTANRIGVNFESAPAAFHDFLLSGENTGKQNSDIMLQVLFSAPQTLRCDAFLLSSVTISLPRNGGDLMLTF